MKTKLLQLLIVFFSISSNLLAAFPTTGNGTQSSPYIITTVSELNSVATGVNSNIPAGASTAYYELANDLTSFGNMSVGIGGLTNPFAGNFDGKGHKVTGITRGTSGSRQTHQYYGFFGAINGATISNLEIGVSFYITNAASLNCAGLAAQITGATTNIIKNCKVTGTIDAINTSTSSGNAKVAGMIGSVGISGASITIINSSVDANITSTVDGAAARTADAAGFIAELGASVSMYIVNCFASGSVTAKYTTAGSTAAGGILATGFNTGGTGTRQIINCYSANTVDATGGNVGGIAGNMGAVALNGSVINNSFALNSHIYGGSQTNRVTPNSGAVLSSNYALYGLDIKVGGSSYSATSLVTGVDGETLSASDPAGQTLTKLNTYVTNNSTYNSIPLKSWSSGVTYPAFNPTLTFTDATISKTYGDANFTQTATSNSLGAITYSSGTTSVATVNSTSGLVTIVGAGSSIITAAQTAYGNYAGTTTTYTVNVATKTLTISGLTGISKVIDGTNAATLSGSATLVGVVGGDAANVVLGGSPSATFGQTTVGNDLQLTVNGYSISGTASGKYSLTQPTGLIANIFPLVSTFTGTGSNDYWSDATHWTYSPLEATEVVVASGELTIDQTPITVSKVTVNAEAKLTLNSGKTLNVSEFTLKSDENGTGTFVDNGTSNITTLNANQYLGTTRNWYISSPVESTTSTTTKMSKYFEYITSGNNTDYTSQPSGSSLYWQGYTPGHTMTAGKGYIALPSETGATLTFSGTLNTGDVNVAISSAGNRFNLIGNPYPCHIAWTMAYAISKQAQIEPSIYIRTNSSGSNSSGWSFVTYNALNGLAVPNHTLLAGGIIPPMQAFWVRAVVSAASPLVLNTTDLTRSHQSSNPLKAPAIKNNDRTLVRLEVTNGTRTDETLVFADANATDGYDGYDSPKYIESNSEVQIFTTVDAQKLVMNGFKNLPLNQEIGLGFIPGTASTFSMKANVVTNLPADVRLILKDNATMIETDLTDQISTYNFSPATYNGDRFSIQFRSPGTTTGFENTNKLKAQVFVNIANKITIQGVDKMKVIVYNSLGQKLNEMISTDSKLVDNTTYKSGVYFVEIIANGKNETHKVVIR